MFVNLNMTSSALSLVIGGGGFIGSHLVSTLLAKGGARACVGTSLSQ